MLGADVTWSGRGSKPAGGHDWKCTVTECRTTWHRNDQRWWWKWLAVDSEVGRFTAVQTLVRVHECTEREHHSLRHAASQPMKLFQQSAVNVQACTAICYVCCVIAEVYEESIRAHYWYTVRWIVLNTGRGPVELTASTGIIKSPGYEGHIYPNNAVCQWIIKSPPGYVRMIRWFAIISIALLLTAQPVVSHRPMLCALCNRHFSTMQYKKLSKADRPAQ